MTIRTLTSLLFLFGFVSFLLWCWFNFGHFCCLLSSLFLSLSFTHIGTHKNKINWMLQQQLDFRATTYHYALFPCEAMHVYLLMCLCAQMCVHSLENVLTAPSFLPLLPSHLLKKFWSLNLLFFIPSEVQQECYLFGNQSALTEMLFSLHPHPPTQHTHILARTHACTYIYTTFQLPGVLGRLAAEGSTTTPPTPKHASEQRAREHRHPQTHTHG